MQGYQKYRKYQDSTGNKGQKFTKILLILAICFVLFLIGKSLFGGNTEVRSTLPESNTNIVGDVNGNTSEDVADLEDTNTNINVNVDVSSADSFDIDTCTKVYSRGSAAEKRVSLTFNVGTTKQGDIDKVLSALANAGVKADFFARGDVAEETPDLIKKISDAGFSVYNLSYSHPHFSDLPESGMSEQLEKAESAISQITGKTTKPFFRPPYGDADEDVLSVISSEGYCPITWTVDALDWSTEYTSAESKERVMSNITNGTIVLMQAANATTAEIVPGIITDLQSQGYNIVNLDTLLAL